MMNRAKKNAKLSKVCHCGSTLYPGSMLGNTWHCNACYQKCAAERR